MNSSGPAYVAKISEPQYACPRDKIKPSTSMAAKLRRQTTTNHLRNVRIAII
jgi:hypothetical protein